MQFLGLCKEINKFIRGDVHLSAIKDSFFLYWNRVHEKGDNSDNIAKAEILNIAVKAYESNHFSKEDLKKIVHQYSSEINHHHHKLNEDITKRPDKEI